MKTFRTTLAGLAAAAITTLFAFAPTAHAASTVSTAVGGDYAVTYATAGTVNIHQSGSTYTVTTTSPLKLEGATCTLPTGTVLATLTGTGTGTTFATNSYIFGTTSCFEYTWTTGTSVVNGDGSISLPGSTGTHLMIKTADAPSLATAAVGGNYSTMFDGAGTVNIHQSGTTYTVTTTSPLKLEGATCTLPTGTVLATLTGTGTGTTFATNSYIFGTTSCFEYTWTTGTSYLNTDNSISLPSNTGWHLLTNTSPATPVATPKAGGTYSAMFDGAGTVSIHQSGTTYTVTTTSPLKLEGATCTLPTGTVLATLTGTGTTFATNSYIFGTTSCFEYTWTTGTSYLNTDNSISLPSNTGWHLLTNTSPATPVATPKAGGTYSAMFDGAGMVSIHQSGTTYTVTTTSPLKLEGATCTLPTGTVLATLTGTGTGTTFATNSYIFGTTSCFEYTWTTGTSYLNTDNSISLPSNTGWHLLTNTSPATPVATPKAGGTYGVQYATGGSVSISAVGTTYTIRVASPFQLEGATCMLPTGTVLAVFTGTGASFASTSYIFSATSCAMYTWTTGTSYLNSDNSISLPGNTGWHLLTHI